MKLKTSCQQCSRMHRRCDQLKPLCGRCLRKGKSCTYNYDIFHDDFQQYESSKVAYGGTHAGVYQFGRLRHKLTGEILTIDESIQWIEKTYNIPKSPTSMKSILLSSAVNRMNIVEFIKGCQYIKQGGSSKNVDKTSFCVYKFRKRDIHEIVW